MRLQLHTPPTLVSVAGQPALLIATRGDRCYVQVSRGAGLNHLRWVPTAAVLAPSADRQEPPAGPADPALPWIRARSDR